MASRILLTAKQREKLIQRIQNRLPCPEEIKINDKDINYGRTVTFAWRGHVFCADRHMAVYQIGMFTADVTEWFKTDLAILLAALLKKQSRKT